MTCESPFQPKLKSEVTGQKSTELSISVAKKLVANMSYSQSRNRVNNRPVKEIELTVEDLQTKFKEQSGLCYWSDLPLNQEFNHIKHHPFAISVERLDNSKGYTYQNTVLTRRLFNLGRMAFDGSEFRHVIKTLKSELSNGC